MNIAPFSIKILICNIYVGVFLLFNITFSFKQHIIFINIIIIIIFFFFDIGIRFFFYDKSNIYYKNVIYV